MMIMHRHMKVGAGCVGAAIFGVLFGWVIFPALLKGQLKKEMALTQKTDIRQMWQKIPFALDFKVYFFNYTNPAEIQKGALPIVKEIGPFYFEEWKEKVEVEENDANDTINYKKKDCFLFRQDLSGPGLTGEEIVVIPHVFMLVREFTAKSLAKVVSREKPAMLNMIGKAINGIFDQPADVFLRAAALDILFRGVIINCDRSEFAPKAVCNALKKENPNGITFEANNQYRFSLFGARNNTVDPHVVTVKRGKKNVMEVGEVIAVDGKSELDIWKDTCNKFVGTDGTVFPPFLTEKDRLQSYSGDLCRSFKPWFQKKTSYQGIKTNRYVANIGDLSTDPELQCLCDSPDPCPPKGLMDLTKCVNAPLYASMPHFLDTDASVQNAIKGLTPDIDAHGIQIDFEPITGTPMVARQRIQFNVQLFKTDKIELLSGLPDSIAPVFWIEEGLALNKTFVKMLKSQLFTPKRIVGVVKWLLITVGSIGAVTSVMYHFKDKIITFAVGLGGSGAPAPGPRQVSPGSPGVQTEKEPNGEAVVPATITQS